VQIETAIRRVSEQRLIDELSECGHDAEVWPPASAEHITKMLVFHAVLKTEI
jgi:hypothetical protein